MGESGTILATDEGGITGIQTKTFADGFFLGQNYPNPFNPATTIEYSIPDAGYVKLEVYTSLGEKVSTLVNGFNSAGSYRVVFDGTDMSSGIYIYRMQSASFIETRKMLLIK